MLPEIIAFFENWLAVSTEGAAPLVELLTHLHDLGEPRAIKPVMLPIVQSWFGQASQLPTAPHCASLLSVLITAVEQLRWIPFAADYLGEQFADGFAYVQLIGPAVDGEEVAIFPSDNIAVGFSLQAPSLFYPPHYHQAIEFYGVLAGTARWQLGHQPPAWQPPGTRIFHDSDVAHAMATDVEPMLTIWAWLGDLESPIIIPAWDWL